MKILLITLLSTLTQASTYAQSFPEKCSGVWTGSMQIFQRGEWRDSVEVRLTISKTSVPNEWIWRTEYLSKNLPMTKDYLLRIKDEEKHSYIMDEKNGIELNAYLFNNKLFSVFETQEILLTSTYELTQENLIFEVTSGKKTGQRDDSVINYSVDNLQRVMFKKSG